MDFTRVGGPIGRNCTTVVTRLISTALIANRISEAGWVRHREGASISTIAACGLEAEVIAAHLETLHENRDGVGADRALRYTGDRHCVGASLDDFPVVRSVALPPCEVETA